VCVPYTEWDAAERAGAAAEDAAQEAGDADEIDRAMMLTRHGAKHVTRLQMIRMAAMMSLMSRKQTPEFLSKKSKAKSDEVETVPKKALDLRLVRALAPPLYAGAMYSRGRV
jgi:hypothetical protein